MKELLGQPEYLHVLANPFLTHALPLAVLGLLLALVVRSHGGARLAIVLVTLSAATVWPAVHYGRSGFDRMQSMADSAGGDWLEVHRHRAEDNAWVFYVVVAAGLAALCVPFKWPKTATPLAWLALIVSAGACAVAAYIAYPGGRIRHREFRLGPPPAAELQAARDEEAHER